MHTENTHKLRETATWRENEKEIEKMELAERNNMVDK